MYVCAEGEGYVFDFCRLRLEGRLHAALEALPPFGHAAARMNSYWAATDLVTGANNDVAAGGGHGGHGQMAAKHSNKAEIDQPPTAAPPRRPLPAQSPAAPCLCPGGSPNIARPHRQPARLACHTCCNCNVRVERKGVSKNALVRMVPEQ